MLISAVAMKNAPPAFYSKARWLQLYDNMLGLCSVKDRIQVSYTQGNHSTNLMISQLLPYIFSMAVFDLFMKTLSFLFIVILVSEFLHCKFGYLNLMLDCTFSRRDEALFTWDTDICRVSDKGRT